MKKFLIIGMLALISGSSINATTKTNTTKVLRKNTVASCQNEAIGMGNEMVLCGMSREKAVRHALNYYLDCVNSI